MVCIEFIDRGFPYNLIYFNPAKPLSFFLKKNITLLSTIQGFQLDFETTSAGTFVKERI
jgi:hypothetical protein